MATNVLIVDDNIQDAWTIEGYLKNAGYGYKHATTYKEAIEYLDKSRFDAVLLDINLNDSHDGVSLAATIDTKYYLPYIFVTGYNQADKYIDLIADLKYKNFIRKPIKEEELIQNLKIVLAANSSLIKISKNCVYDLFDKIIINNKEKISLTPREIKFIEILAVNKNRYVSREVLKDKIWEGRPPQAENALRELKRLFINKLDDSIDIDSDNNGYRLNI